MSSGERRGITALAVTALAVTAVGLFWRDCSHHSGDGPLPSPVTIITDNDSLSADSTHRKGSDKHKKGKKKKGKSSGKKRSVRESWTPRDMLEDTVGSGK